MNLRKASHWDPRSASLLLLAAACLLPFLLPRHFPPLRTFYDEWIAFALGIGTVGFYAATRTTPSRIPVLAAWLFGFSLFLMLRACAVPAAYPQGALLWAIYALQAAFLIAIVHALSEHFGRDLVCEMLASFLLAGAMLNAISGVIQVVGIPKPIDSVISYLYGFRAIGNIGQSNLYANYIALGEASLAYLYSRGRIRCGMALAAGALLLTGAALAASRSSSLYSLAFASLGWIAMRRAVDVERIALGRAAFTLAFAGVLTQWLVPVAFKSLGFRIEGGFDRSVSDDWDSRSDETASLRLQAWGLAARIFLNAPWLGEGPGEFAGAAFLFGLPPQMAARDLFTSPHNLLLQLLAETGLVGTAFVIAGLVAWARGSIPAFLRTPTGPLWWAAACTSVEMIHALLEYPFWYAHFLSVAALAFGAGATGTIRVPSRAVRSVLIASAVAGAILLAINLRDYFRFELASPIYAGRSLGSDRDFRTDLDTLAGLKRGLLGPRAELWLFLALPLDAGTATGAIEIGDRVMRTWPTRDVVVRQSIFLALAGREQESRALFRKAVGTFSNRPAIRNAIAAAPAPARAALESELPAQEVR